MKKFEVQISLAPTGKTIAACHQPQAGKGRAKIPAKPRSSALISLTQC
jgi:hypothetical protein